MFSVYRNALSQTIWKPQRHVSNETIDVRTLDARVSCFPFKSNLIACFFLFLIHKVAKVVTHKRTEPKNDSHFDGLATTKLGQTTAALL